MRALIFANLVLTFYVAGIVVSLVQAEFRRHEINRTNVGNVLEEMAYLRLFFLFYNYFA
jgi:hypothetical protein